MNLNSLDRVFIVAEIGANHNGEAALAKEMVAAAAQCGADAVKFQTYTAAELLCDNQRVINWKSAQGETTEPVGRMFDRLTLKREEHAALFEYASSLGLIPFSTPFSTSGVDFLEELHVPFYKVASSDINYIYMLEKIAATGKPVLLSVGKNPLSEVDLSVSFLERLGVKEMAIMHCVATYPTKIEEVNLRVLKTLKTAYPEYGLGFSDHSVGIAASLGAAALGAKVIEKHFTTDNTLDGPDQIFSMNPESMKSLVEGIRELEKALGSSRKTVTPMEMEQRKLSVRSLSAAKPIKKGEILTRGNVAMLRPGYGISPFDLDKVLGMRVTRDVAENSTLTWDDLK